MTQRRRPEYSGPPACLDADIRPQALTHADWKRFCRRASRRGSASQAAQGFTLLEVMVSLTVLAIGAALALSLISGSLGNIRKVQQRTRTVEHAEAVMELALLDDSIRQPTAYSGDFEDGTRWSVRIEDYVVPEEPSLQSRNLPQNIPVKLLCYTVEMYSPGARASDYSLQTLKLVNKTAEDRLMGAQ